MKKKLFKKYDACVGFAAFFGMLEVFSLFDYFFGRKVGLDILLAIVWLVSGIVCCVLAIYFLKKIYNVQKQEIMKLRRALAYQNEIVEEKEWEVLKHAN